MADSIRLQKEFFSSIKRGTGRAYLLARDNPDVDFSASIIRAALKNYAYDGQCEPSRADYLFALSKLSGQQITIRQAVIDALSAAQEDTWATTQLAELGFLFAREGSRAARTALYRQFRYQLRYGTDWVGIKEIASLDGLAGLYYALKQLSRSRTGNYVSWHENYYIQQIQERNPDLDVWASLYQRADQDATVRCYLDDIAAARSVHAENDSPAPEPIALEQAILVPQQRALSFKLRRHLLPEQLQWLAERLLAEEKLAVVENILWIFQRRAFPLAYQPILALAQRKISSHYRITEFATSALAFFQAADIRDFALKRLPTTTSPAQYTDLLRHNYQPGDATLLTAIIDRFHSEHIIEQLTVSFIDIYRDNPTPECQAPLIALYQKMNCGIHREDVVQLLIDNNVLPSWLNDELPFDSNNKIHLLHQRLNP